MARTSQSMWTTGEDWPAHAMMTARIDSQKQRNRALSGLRRFGLFPNPPSDDVVSLTNGTTDTNPFPSATTIIGLGITGLLAWWLWPKGGR